MRFCAWRQLGMLLIWMRSPSNLSVMLIVENDAICAEIITSIVKPQWLRIGVAMSRVTWVWLLTRWRIFFLSGNLTEEKTIVTSAVWRFRFSRYTENTGCFLMNLARSRLCSSPRPAHRQPLSAREFHRWVSMSITFGMKGSSYLCSQITGGVENAILLHVNIFHN
jgi:hypothetical protein